MMNNNISAYFFFIFLLCYFPLLSTAEPRKLDDFNVWRINANQPIEPSGLTFRDDELYTVCDDANVIFKINISNDFEGEAVIAETLDASQLSATALDLEGITVVGGDFFVVSESHHKLVRLKNNTVTWVPEFGGVYSAAFNEGLFQVYNAGLEAAIYLGDQTFLMSVERQPRGLIEVKFDDDFKYIISQTNQLFDDHDKQLDNNRSPDWTGLYLYDGVIYALHRNAYIINELIKGEDGTYREGESWSYEHIVKHPDYAYQDMQFGHAEGLAVNNEYFYLVIDNNNNPSFKNTNDNRPILIRAKRK